MAYGRLQTRVAALEGTTAADTERDIEEGAKRFRDTIERLCERFSEEDGRLLPAQQEGWSPAMRLAWTLRFGTAAEFHAMLADCVRMLHD